MLSLVRIGNLSCGWHEWSQVEVPDTPHADWRMAEHRRQAPTELETELSRLGAESATLRMEREIQKKGNVIPHVPKVRG